MLAIFCLSAPGLVMPYYSTAAGEITVLVAGLISIVSYVLVMRVGNRPLQIVEAAFVASESGTTGGAPRLVFGTKLFSNAPSPRPGGGLGAKTASKSNCLLHGPPPGRGLGAFCTEN